MSPVLSLLGHSATLASPHTSRQPIQRLVARSQCSRLNLYESRRISVELNAILCVINSAWMLRKSVPGAVAHPALQTRPGNLPGNAAPAGLILFIEGPDPPLQPSGVAVLRLGLLLFFSGSPSRKTGLSPGRGRGRDGQVGAPRNLGDVPRRQEISCTQKDAPYKIYELYLEFSI